MANNLEDFYLRYEEPLQSTLRALREIILQQDKHITEEWKYYMPCFCYNKKMFCFLWVKKKTRQPYIEIVEGKRINHPKLISEQRSKMKILLFDASKDLPIKAIIDVLQQAVNLYKKENIKVMH